MNIISEDDAVKHMVTSFKTDPQMDFHQIVADMASIKRKQAKIINLGLFYGMGKAKLQQSLNLETRDEAEKLFEKYHSNVHFVKALMNATSRDASRDGEIQTIGGRVCRFDKWERDVYEPGVLRASTSWEEAAKKYGENNIRRAFTYKALNKLIQGSAADMTKQAMLDLYEEGIIPHIQVHDELDISIEDDHQGKKIVEIMQDAIPLNIPNKVDFEQGPTWGDIK